jgi:cytochrome c oxidase accessory protein FixG
MAMAGTQTPSSGEDGEVRLYEKWRKIYPLWVNGGFQTGRRVVLAILVGVYYIGPWLTYHGRPAIWLNLPERKFSILWATFWPQEMILLSWLLIIAAFTLFLFTVVAGRIFCGWVCPQTVWTLCYVWLERLVEGDRNQRMRLDRGPWNRKRIVKKAFKYSLWAVLALSIGVTFVGYFSPIRELLPRIVSGELGGWEQFWLLFPSAGSFLISGVLREQVCFHMCPYARFQSVMFDRDTLIISYDAERGEPRGSRPRKADPAALGKGDCVNCQLCVSVCPTGIDIRDGLQYQCIGCAACIDACNGVMEKMGYAPDLIQYSSENADEDAQRSWMRPRLFGYGAVLCAMLLTFTWTISHRVPLGLDIIRDRSRLYREHWDGSVENVYTLKIMNREEQARTYRISATGALPVTLETRTGKSEVTVPAGGQSSVNVRLVKAPGVDGETNSAIEFQVETLDEPQYGVREPSRFILPSDQAGGSQ